MSSFVDKLIFPAPSPTYTRETFKKHLCWIPWNEAVSGDRVDDESYAEGIPCMWLPAPRAAGVILFCHGNAEDLGMCFPFVRHMRDQFKMNVLAVEYPGYGLLHGLVASEAGLKEAALTAFRFVLDEMKVAYEQIMLFGRSVGSGPSVFLASRFPVGGLILVAAFASVREAAKSLVGNLIAHVLDERFPNISLIGNVSCPTLFIHGEKDSLVPPSHSVALFKNCRARKLLITPPGMEHNTNLFTDAQFLAVPAINFFGLPGYQQDSPPQMPTRFFEDGRQDFLLRKAARRKQPVKKEGISAMDSSPWFFLCGCPTSRTKQQGMEPTQQIEPQQCEWDAETLTDCSLEGVLRLDRVRRTNIPAGKPSHPFGLGVAAPEGGGRVVEEPLPRGDPATAARETAASAAANVRGGGGDSGDGIDSNLAGTWGDSQDIHAEEVEPMPFKD